MTSWLTAADRVTVKVALAALSSEVVTSLIERVGRSSSVIVSVPVESLMVALVGLERVSVTVSLFSSVESLRTGTLNVPVVDPAAIVRVPLVAV